MYSTFCWTFSQRYEHIWNSFKENIFIQHFRVSILVVMCIGIWKFSVGFGYSKLGYLKCCSRQVEQGCSSFFAIFDDFSKIQLASNTHNSMQLNPKFQIHPNPSQTEMFSSFLIRFVTKSWQIKSKESYLIWSTTLLTVLDHSTFRL